MPTLELRHLDLRYANLRIADPYDGPASSRRSPEKDSRSPSWSSPEPPTATC